MSTVSTERNVTDEFLGKRLRRRRHLLGLSQQQLAESVGIGFQQIQKYECGANRMSAMRLWQFAQKLGVSIGYFYDEDAVPAGADMDGRFLVIDLSRVPLKAAHRLKVLAEACPPQGIDEVPASLRSVA